MNSEDIKKYMQIACEQMLMSEGNTKVGCVLVKDNHIISFGYKSTKQHAERMAIEIAVEKKINLKNSILFTTLEPCIKISPNQEKKSCCELIEQYKIKIVYIGSYDPNPVVNRKGWKFLKEKKIIRKEFHTEFTKKIADNNKVFSDYFSECKGNEGQGKVNHKDNGIFKIITQDPLGNEVIFNIEWNLAGQNIAHIYSSFPMKTAHAIYATDFKEVENPLMYPYSHSVSIPLNEIGIFDLPNAFILVKPTEIQSGPIYGDEHCFVKFKYLVKFK